MPTGFCFAASTGGSIGTGKPERRTRRATFSFPRSTGWRHGEFTYGASETNAVLTHERAGSRLTSGVSTTPHYYNRADFYARTDNGDSCHGYIYKIDRDVRAARD